MRIKSKKGIASLFVGATMLCAAGVSSAAIKQIAISGSAVLKAASNDTGTGWGIIYPRGMNVAPENTPISITNKPASTIIYDTVPQNIVGQYANGLVSNNGTSGYLDADGYATIEPFNVIEQLYVDAFGLSSTAPVIDFEKSGFNTETGYYELKSYLEQFVNANGVAGWAYMPSLFVYDPSSGLGYLQTLQCTEKWPPAGRFTPEAQAQLAAQGVNSTGDICPQAGVTGLRRIRLNEVAPTDPTKDNPNLMVFDQAGISRIAFDNPDPTKFSVQVADAVELQLLIDYEMRSVPVPAAVWLFGSAVLGLLGVSRKKAKNNKV